jgi:hypothetical protein
MSIYKLTINGQCLGQDIQNHFAYRLGVGINPELIPNFGIDVLAEEWMQEVMPTWLAVHPQSYLLQDIKVEVFSTGVLGFTPVFTAPQVVAVNQPGSIGGETMGPASCFVYRANLEPMLITSALTAPKKGWMFVGPATEGHFADGQLIDGYFSQSDTSFQVLARKMAENLESIDPPAVYYPVRIKQVVNAGVLHITGYSDIKSWVLDRRLHFLRSRQLDK